MFRERLRYENRSGIKFLFTEYNIREDIDMGSFRIGDGTLFTSAAFTCIALAAHNSESGRGLVGHFNSIASLGQHSSQEPFRDALSSIASLGKAEHTDIWLGGGSPSISRGEDIVLTDRQLAEGAVTEFAANFRLPENHVEVEWSDEAHVVDVELDCPSGVLVVHDYPDMPMRVFRRMIEGL